MAIFHSYVKLPEGIYKWVASSIAIFDYHRVMRPITLILILTEMQNEHSVRTITVPKNVGEHQTDHDTVMTLIHMTFSVSFTYIYKD